MKFTAGYWELRPDVHMMFAEHVHDVETDAQGITVYASTKPIYRATSPWIPHPTPDFPVPTTRQATRHRF